MNEDTIVKFLNNALERLKKRLHSYTVYIHVSNILKLLLSSSIPILIDLAEKRVELLLIVSIFSAVITIIQGATSLLGFDDKKQKIAAVILKIEKEKLLYTTNTEPYDKDSKSNYHLLIKQLEDEMEDVLVDQKGEN